MTASPACVKSNSVPEAAKMSTSKDIRSRILTHGLVIWMVRIGYAARGIVFLTNHYDSNGRVDLQTQADMTTVEFAYTLDGLGRVEQTDLTSWGFLHGFTAAGRMRVPPYRGLVRDGDDLADFVAALAAEAAGFRAFLGPAAYAELVRELAAC